MFDVLDVQIPAPATGGPIGVRQREFAFGVSDERSASVGGVALGRIARPDEAYRVPEIFMGAADRGGWMVLHAASAANAAARDDAQWARFLAALVSVLEGQADWAVWCESDCDQRPVARLVVSATGLAALLDGMRADQAPAALVATPPKTAPRGASRVD